MPSDLRRITHRRQLKELWPDDLFQYHVAPGRVARSYEIDLERRALRQENRLSYPPQWRQYLGGPLHDSWVHAIRRTRGTLEVHINHLPAINFVDAWNANWLGYPALPVILRFTDVAYAGCRRAMPNGKLTWSNSALSEQASWCRESLWQGGENIQFAALITSWKAMTKLRLDYHLVLLVEARALEIVELQEAGIRKTLGDEPALIWRELLQESKASAAGLPVFTQCGDMEAFLTERYGERFAARRINSSQ